MELKLLKFQMWWLQQLGMWAIKPRSFKEWFRPFIVFCLQILILLSAIANLMQCNKQVDCSLENFCYTILIITGIYSFAAFMLEEKRFQRAITILYQLVEEFRTYERTKKDEQTAKKYTMAITIYAMFGILEYVVGPLFDYYDCIERNNEANALTCGLPTPGSFPFNEFMSPGYEVAFIFQCFAASAVIHSILHPLTLCCSMTYHVISQLRILKENLDKICSTGSEERYNLLQRCVKHHVAIINFSDQIVAAVNKLMLIHVGIWSILFTLVGFQILKVRLVKMYLTVFHVWSLSRYLTIFFGFFSIVVVMSTIGQILINESMEVAERAYNIPWYDESVEFQNMIKLIILRCNKPLLLRCASVGELSFSSFAGVMKTTYSYLALLYKVVLSSENESA